MKSLPCYERLRSMLSHLLRRCLEKLTPVFDGPGVCSAAVLTDGQLFTWGRDAGGAGDKGIPRPLSGLGEHVFVQARTRAADHQCSSAAEPNSSRSAPHWPPVPSSRARQL